MFSTDTVRAMPVCCTTCCITRAVWSHPPPGAAGRNQSQVIIWLLRDRRRGRRHTTPKTIRRSTSEARMPEVLRVNQSLGASAFGHYEAHGAAQVKLSAASMLPDPLYRATCGYGHSGRVRIDTTVLHLRCEDRGRGASVLAPLLHRGDHVEDVRTVTAAAMAHSRHHVQPNGVSTCGFPIVFRQLRVVVHGRKRRDVLILPAVIDEQLPAAVR